MAPLSAVSHKINFNSPRAPHLKDKEFKELGQQKMLNVRYTSWCRVKCTDNVSWVNK
jgi:hypothetical protein